MLRWMALAAVLSGLPAEAGAHDWFTGLMSPSGERCCAGRDCVAVGLRRNPQTKGEELDIEGIWVPAERDKILSTPSPDGNAYACWWRSWTGHTFTPKIRCIILPGMS